jgi:hypothetical protein
MTGVVIARRPYIFCGASARLEDVGKVSDDVLRWQNREDILCLPSWEIPRLLFPVLDV